MMLTRYSANPNMQESNLNLPLLVGVSSAPIGQKFDHACQASVPLSLDGHIRAHYFLTQSGHLVQLKN